MIRLLSAGLLVFGLSLSPVLAQSTKIFLASTGLDTNDGSRGSPKRTLQAAHDAVASGGELVILDTAGYGPVGITKGIGIVVPPGVNGFVTVTAANTDAISIAAGPGDVVTLRGLIVEGPGPDSGNGRGIAVFSNGTVIVEDTIVRNFPTGMGYFGEAPSSQFIVRRGAVRNAFVAFDIEDFANSAKMDAAVTDVELTKTTGDAFFVQRRLTGANIRVIVTRCSVSGSAGNVFETIGAGARIVVDGCTIGASGVAFRTAGGEAVLNNNTVAQNQTVFATSNGGVNYTFGTNRFYNNATFGPAPSAMNQQ